MLPLQTATLQLQSIELGQKRFQMHLHQVLTRSRTFLKLFLNFISDQCVHVSGQMH